MYSRFSLLLQSILFDAVGLFIMWENEQVELLECDGIYLQNVIVIHNFRLFVTVLVPEISPMIGV